ncbi:Uncharacterised protein [Proteus mirabilis]|uniref:hypothetical protein n=1 Tax=Proteus mirabilis TaxID=584 RepID=UPI000DFAD850|nr:hypothetical protein [Proteus mirabilis]SUC17988.1 Uncharacterised protein [Proteus mirabilis]SUC22093.1 Uncharacterised protein [Proteus mirabilis]SUC22106.1 Uncharacterised protein [Proteus mirabilis]
MHNSFYSANGLYEHLRAFYMDSFPHARKYNCINFLNFLLRSEKCSGILQDEDRKLVFIEKEHHWINSYFNDAEFLAKIAEDSNAFNHWLLEEGYIRNGVATKLLVNSTSLYKSQPVD